MNQLYADSTIGLTAYNVIAMNAKPLTFDEILSISTMMQHAHLKSDQMRRALDKLIKLQRIDHNSDGSYSLKTKERFLVFRRDLSDYDARTMEGGWNGWMVKDPRLAGGQGFRHLEAILGQPIPSRQPVRARGVK